LQDDIVNGEQLDTKIEDSIIRVREIRQFLKVGHIREPKVQFELVRLEHLKEQVRDLFRRHSFQVLKLD
jgi:hypothetical protein